MPCIIDNDRIDDWLNLDVDGHHSLTVFASDLLTLGPVNPAINKPGMKDIAAIDNWHN